MFRRESLGTAPPVADPVSMEPLPVRLTRLISTHDNKYDCWLRKPDSAFHARFQIVSDMSAEVVRILQAAIPVQGPSKRSSAKAICEAIVDEVSSATRVQLQVKIMWKNSKSLRDARSDAQNDLLVLLAPGEGCYKVQPWSPRDFYDSVHVPSPDCKVPNVLQLDRLTCQLYPFQRRAIQWLLCREGKAIDSNQHETDASCLSQVSLPYGFFRFTDLEGRSCFASHWLGLVTTDESLLLSVESQLRGGILAEEMGLGKTVEIVGLICSNERSEPIAEHSEADVLRLSKATLIITPPSILQQWKAEIQAHAPSLRVMIYEGIRSAINNNNDDEMMNKLLQHDIVLSTYHTLANEIHYSSETPNRNLRNDKKYERRKSPLVQIEWWRVVLDECQMVESGVSNAARVARLIPRRNAWAVSGTPLKKDAKDLLGLLIFLHLEPYCLSASIWDRLVTSYKPVFKRLFGAIALRHTKEQVKADIQLPPQKRVVLSIPFTQIEEQHYSTLYQQMCEDCGLDTEGHPLADTWDPNSSAVIEKMRTWLTRLRQTCLHPEVGDRNRRALGHNEGPLRTVGEVLDVMIVQNDTAGRTEERSYLLAKLRKGQILEHADHSQEALEIWLEVLRYVKVMVEECRQEIRSSEMTAPQVASPEDEVDEMSSSRTLLRLRLRSALEVEHISTFFVANALFQIKSDEKATLPDSERFKELEKMETEAYEKAKLIRKELLTETQSKADSLMAIIRAKAAEQSYTIIPNFRPPSSPGGIESRNILTRLVDLCDSINLQAEQVDNWREKMIELLLLPLVDQEEAELQGDEYETSTKQQDEVYVYMEALRAAVADRHDVLTGQNNILIRGEMNTALQQAINGEGHSPELMRHLLRVRSKIKPKEELGSIRGIITELRALKSSLRTQEERGSSRASTEIAIINKALETLQLDATRQAKANSGLEKELDIFRDTVNARLEFYRQLQTISDSVAPYEEDLNEEEMRAVLDRMVTNEAKSLARIATLKARGRYLLHIRDESTTEDVQRKCIICQEHFEIGALTSCGHSYCKECLRLWWNAHRNCPTCKKHLSRNDLFQITYKPQEMTMQEEAQLNASIPGSASAATSIYSGINSLTLNQIKNIDVEGSFGTKIDTLARHVLWIRENDPGAKSIVFSQFKDFLDVLARAFTKFKIGYASIDNKNGAETFKKDPSVSD